MKQLERLARLRAAKERLQEAAYAKAQARVTAADHGIGACVSLRDAAGVAARAGLIDGNWDAWWLGESTRALAERKEESLRQEREELAQQAARDHAIFAIRRLEAEQARLLVKRTLAALRVEEERRTQTTSDDRFAARAHWMAAIRRQRVKNF